MASATAVATERKYEKYFVKGAHTSHDIKGRQVKTDQGVQLLTYDTHDDCPFYFEAFVYYANDNYAVQAAARSNIPILSG